MTTAYDFLCRHHNCDDFDCGHQLLNDELRDAVDNLPDPGRVLFIVAHDLYDIRGFITLNDATIVLEAGGDPRSCCMLPSWARDRHARPEIAQQLIKKATAIVASRQAWKHYEAVVATTFYTERIGPFLRRLGFVECPLDPTLWYKYL